MRELSTKCSSTYWYCLRVLLVVDCDIIMSCDGGSCLTEHNSGGYKTGFETGNFNNYDYFDFYSFFEAHQLLGLVD